jgi:saccharopine dehydrogenase-like NADP-dependent oxidoreductase
MKKILVLGAGRSTPFLIHYLLEHAAAEDWSVTVGDREREQAENLLGGHPRGRAIRFEVDRLDEHRGELAAADVVVNLLPPNFQPIIAHYCLEQRRSMVSASYRNHRIGELEAEASRRGLLLLTEVGLDPGIDLMSAMELIDRIHADGGVVETFASYGSGVPAPESATAPIRYAVTWNPRNVVMAGENGAQYLRDGTVKILPWHRMFQETWTVEVDGIGPMEAYPNRDSLVYRDSFGLREAHTLVRGTLRYPGWGEVWQQLVRLGLPNEQFTIPGLKERSFRELVEIFLPDDGGSCRSVEARVAGFLHLSPTGHIMDTLRWLGLFSDQRIGGADETPAAALGELLKSRLVLPEGGRDMIILQHQLGVRYPEQGDRRERITSTFVAKGEPGGMTAMARSVGLPLALAVRLLLRGELTVTGCPLPTEPQIYRPLLEQMAAEGVEFKEKVESL